MALLLSRFGQRFSRRIDKRISLALGRRLTGFQVYSKDFAPYRFVDLYNAVEEYCQQRSNVETIQSEHQEDLNNILNGQCPNWASRDVKKSTQISWPADYERNRSLPVDCFWICRGSSSGLRGELILRLRFDFYQQKSILEVASEAANLAETCLEWIVKQSVETSIYRNRVLELAYEAGTRDQYGDVERPGRLRVLFKAVEPVDDKDIIIADEVREILWRNVIDLHLRREILKAHHVLSGEGFSCTGRQEQERLLPVDISAARCPIQQESL